MDEFNQLQHKLPYPLMIDITWSGNDGYFKYYIIDCETMKPIHCFHSYQDLKKHIKEEEMIQNVQ